MASLGDFYSSLPLVTKTWGTVTLASTVLTTFGLLNPKQLYLNFPLVLKNFEIWRPLTNFVWLGPFGPSFAVNLILLVRHGSQLESSTYENRRADFVYMLMLGMGLSLAFQAINPFGALKLPFLSTSLVFMVVYVWSREFPNTNINLMGLVNIIGFYLPWAYLVLDIIFGRSPVPGLTGIFIGHTYFFFNTLYPAQGGPYYLQTPQWVRDMVAKWDASLQQNRQQRQVPMAPQRMVAQPPPSASAATPSPSSSSSSSVFRGRSYRLDRD